MLALLGICAAACGTESATTAPSPTTAIVAQTTSLTGDSVPATGVDPQEGFDGLAPTTDRSILSLVLEPGEIAPGRFRLQRGPNTETIMTVEGRYWITGQDNVYTSLDIDSDLVITQMQLLAEIVEDAGGQASDSPYLASIRDHYRGDEFQIGLADLARSLGVGGLPTEWAEQWAWFVRAGGDPLQAEMVACEAATTSLDAAARDWVRDLDIQFTDGMWVFPVEAFYAALAPHVEAASICEQVIEPGPIPDIVIEVSNDSFGRRVNVLVDDNRYTDRDPELAFWIAMLPDDSVGGPPNDPRPAPLFTIQNSYLAAIGVCGELPWIYSNFAAANTYESPQRDGYLGPVVFASGWYCEDEVPEERRHEEN